MLLDDVKTLQRRLAGFDPENKESLFSLETELGMRLKQSRVVSRLEYRSGVPGNPLTRDCRMQFEGQMHGRLVPRFRRPNLARQERAFR